VVLTKRVDFLSGEGTGDSLGLPLGLVVLRLAPLRGFGALALALAEAAGVEGRAGGALPLSASFSALRS